MNIHVNRMFMNIDDNIAILMESYQFLQLPSCTCPGICRLQSRSFVMSTGSWKDAVTRHLSLLALSSLLSFLEIVQKQFRTRFVFQEQRQYEESGPLAPRWFVQEWKHHKSSVSIAKSHCVMRSRHSAISAKVQLLVHVHEQGPVTRRGCIPQLLLVRISGAGLVQKAWARGPLAAVYQRFYGVCAEEPWMQDLMDTLTGSSKSLKGVLWILCWH